MDAIEGLTGLSAAEQGIVSLRNVDLAYRFDNLNLSSNPLGDLSPLAGLLQLQELNLAYCSLFRGSLFDAEPLASIRSLQDVDLSHNYLLDIEPLLALPLLQDVNLSSTYASDDSENPAYWIYKVLRAREVDVTLGESPLENYSFLFDPGLAQAIREQVGNGVGWSQLQQNLTDLDASARGIQSLRGLELCTNLESLSLGDNLIADLSPLSELTKLTYLDLGVDVGAYPEGNPFKDLSPLANLWSLESLNLQGCGATDFSVLGSLPSLVSVNVRDTLLQSGDSIVARLEASGVGLTIGGDVQFSRILAPSLYAALEAEDLLSLDISVMQLEDHGISSLDGIGIFQNLEQLNVGGNRITDLSPLAGLPLLHTLDLNGEDFYSGDYWEEGTYNAVSDLSVLTTLPSLSTFNARGNHISNIEPLLDCPALSNVNVTDNFLLVDYYSGSGVSPNWVIAQQLQAREVNVYLDTDRTDWYRLFPDPVLSDYFREKYGYGMSASQLAQIESIDITEPVTDLTGLEILYNLETLKLSNCYAQDLSPLSDLSNLTELTLAREDETEVRLIEDLSPLAGLSLLEDLNLQGQGVSNIDVLLEIQTLQNVNLSGNYLDTREGSSVDAVLQMLGYVFVDLSNQRDIWNHISDAGLERAIRNQLNLSPDQAITQADWEALRLLVAKGYAIEDIDSLSLASELGVAVLAGNNISDPSVLANLERLGLIDLSNAPEVFPELENAVTDLSTFAGLTNLERLYLMNNQVADVSPLLEMRALNYLMLDGNPLDLREDSDTVRLLEALIARGTNVFYDDRYRSGLAEVQDNPQAYGLFEEAQLRGLALGKPILEQVDGAFQLQLDVFESTDLIEWLPGQGSFQEVEGQLIWTPTNPGTTKFYSIEAQ
ncbi:leucine-rich repeat domain-containing protein [Coraliomargarita algicola]|uniref:Leucine-rich repeat domain-containing protein n=1 Tax=Coraliomargarita algicola TaxID=3092156 RepID=A0ABZ0RTL7_9BACT|nr:leucine-rich repeat domain-containing protein [Coraliomargarita sp. J2-16]WPJ98150.1 leucine-rich repeat domain-containing protein [Coraliomargarita sp. J2-16]